MNQADTTKLGNLAHLTARHRRKVIVAWIVLTLFGAFAASQVSKRWYQSFSIPGKSAYEANQRTLKQFGTGVRPPDVVVFHTAGDATKSAAIEAAMARAVAAAAILNTFTLIWALTYVTNVSIIVEFLIALVGLGVAIDYALLMIFRFRDELRDGRDVETALVETMTHAGRSVIVSGSTVAVGLLSMILLPLPFIRSIGIGGMLIPPVSVLAAITLIPALLSVLGQRINSVRVLPKRFVDRGHPEDGPWGRWARFVNRRPLPIALTGLAIVAALVVFGVQLNPNEAQMKNFPGSGDAIVGRDALGAAG